jgi:hypothetical protein
MKSILWGKKVPPCEMINLHIFLWPCPLPHKMYKLILTPLMVNTLKVTLIIQKAPVTMHDTKNSFDVHKESEYPPPHAHTPFHGAVWETIQQSEGLVCCILAALWPQLSPHMMALSHQGAQSSCYTFLLVMVYFQMESITGQYSRQGKNKSLQWKRGKNDKV